MCLAFDVGWRRWSSFAHNVSKGNMYIWSCVTFQYSTSLRYVSFYVPRVFMHVRGFTSEQNCFVWNQWKSVGQLTLFFLNLVSRDCWEAFLFSGLFCWISVWLHLFSLIQFCALLWIGLLSIMQSINIQVLIVIPDISIYRDFTLI